MENNDRIPDLETISRRSDGTHDFNKMMQAITFRPRVAMRWMQDRLAQLLKDPKVSASEAQRTIRAELKNRPWEDPSPA